MRPEQSPIFDFGADNEHEDDSYLVQDEGDDASWWRPVPRPLNVVLKAVRRRLGLTQRQMAALMEVSLRSYKGYEIEDVRKVPATALQLLAERTDISASYLLTGYEAMIDYGTVVGEVATLQQMIWEMCLRRDGHKCGMNTQLPVGKAVEIAKMLLTERDRRRREEDNPNLQVTRSDILEAIEECTDHNHVADWEWENIMIPHTMGARRFRAR